MQCAATGKEAKHIMNINDFKHKTAADGQKKLQKNLRI